MKKITITLFAIALSFGAFAQQQRDTMFVHKGQTIFHSATAEIDSIVFVRTSASVPMGSTVTIRDTVEITVRDTVEVVVRDTIEVEIIVRDTIEIETIVRDTVEIETIVRDTIEVEVIVRDTIEIEIAVRDTIFYCPIAVSGITLYPPTANLHLGTTLLLTAVVLPENASNRTVIWTSSNPAVATVNQEGLVTAIYIGEATITATTQDGNHTATSAITILPPRGCNANPLAFTLGVPYFATNDIWTIPGTNGRSTQEWSDAVRAPGCDKTTFAGGSGANANTDCRNATNGFNGHYFTWCMVIRFANQLCPYPWRVPTQQDFIDLDLNLGGTGENRSETVNGFSILQQVTWYIGIGLPFLVDNPTNIWGGARYTGMAHALTFNGSAYWSSTEVSDTQASRLFVSGFGGVHPQDVGSTKNYGFAIRCVRNVE